MKVTVMPIVVWAFGTVSKGLEKKQEKLDNKEESRPSCQQHGYDRLEYLKESWRQEEICGQSDIRKSPTVKTYWKTSIYYNYNYYYY